MANRVATPNTFASLTTALATNLDQNSAFFQTAFNDSSLGYVNGIPVDTGSANVYTIALPFGTASAYQDGMNVEWIPSNTNSGASTLTVSPLGSVSILTPAGNPLLGGELSKNRPVRMTYKSASPTGFRIIGPCPAILPFASASSSVTLECAGCTSVFAGAAFTVTGQNIVLNHLSQGVCVTVAIANNSGSTAAFAIFCSDPSGNNLRTLSVVAGGIGGASDIGSGFSFNLPNNSYRVFSGMVTPAIVWLT